MKVTRQIEVGQTVWVSSKCYFLPSEPSLNEYVVTKVNTRSVYVKRKDSDYEWRFDKRTLTAKSFDGLDTIWLDPDDYWSKISRIKERKQLIGEIQTHLPRLRLEELQEIKQILEVTK